MYPSALTATQAAAHYVAQTPQFTNISGATASTYTATAADGGHSVRVNVTASNAQRERCRLVGVALYLGGDADQPRRADDRR